MKTLTPAQQTAILTRQGYEITEYHLYTKLADRCEAKHPQTAAQLRVLAEAEKRHYDILKSFSGSDVAPKRGMIRVFSLMSRFLGLHFTLHFMERNEESAQSSYDALLDIDPIFAQIKEEEEAHEQELISMIDSHVMTYVGSFVLGLNDAIVEVTGTVAGLTVALGNTKLIGMVGLIGGIAAAMSMAGSEYLSTKEDGGDNPKKAAMVTGVAYIITVAFLIWPYFVFAAHFTALLWTMISSVLVIALFNFYIAIAKNISFKSRFIEMTLISLGVAALSFLIGELISSFFGITVGTL
jgi:VIT1/CCC1 family predicted Fe2+/Mn2+ transporter